MKFETDEDLQNEVEISQKICDAFKCDFFKKNPCPPYNADISLFRGQKLVAFAEIRLRNKGYSTYKLSLQKFISLQTLAEKTRLPVLFVLSVEGKILYLDVLKIKDVSYCWWTRTDPRYAMDSEPAIEFPMNNFNRIS